MQVRACSSQVVGSLYKGNLKCVELCRIFFWARVHLANSPICMQRGEGQGWLQVKDDYELSCMRLVRIFILNGGASQVRRRKWQDAPVR